MPKVKLNLPAGHAKARALNAVKSGLENLYHEIRQDDGSFGHDLTARIGDYNVNDTALGVEGSIRDIARQNGLEKKLDKYIQGNVISSIKGRLGYLLDLTTSIKDGLEDVVEGVEIAGTVAAGVPTAGAGSVAVQIGAMAVEVPLYIATQTAYSLIAGILGYASGTYKFTKKGTKNYLEDMAKGYAGAIGNAIPVVGSLIELGTNLDDKRPRIAEAASRKTGTWLLNQIREQRGLPIDAEEREKDLEWLVGAVSAKIKKIVRGLKPAPLADYSSVSKTPAYGADVTSNRAYSPIAA